MALTIRIVDSTLTERWTTKVGMHCVDKDELHSTGVYACKACVFMHCRCLPQGGWPCNLRLQVEVGNWNSE